MFVIKHSIMGRGKLRQDIQQLRGIAVLAVMLNHLSRSWLPGGYLGVDMFFTVSGFVITHSILANDSTEMSRISFFVEFWIRRAFRLWPMLFVTVFATVSMLSITGLAEPDSMITGLTAVLGVSNFRLLFGKLEYFALDTSSDWFMHTWSLAVEEQIYLVLALVFTAFGGGASVRRSRRRRNAVAVLIGILALLSLVISLTPASTELVRFYSPHTRFYQIAMGVSLALAQTMQDSQILEKYKGIRRYLSFGLVIVLIVQFATEFLKEDEASFFATITTSAILVLATPNQRANGLFSSTWLRNIGDRSYSLYLIHWPMHLFIKEFIGEGSRDLFLSGGLTLALGIISYEWIENTTRHLWKTVLRSTAVGIAFVSLGLVLTVSFYIYQTIAPTSPSETQDERNERTARYQQSLLNACSNEASDFWIIGDSHLGAIVAEISKMRRGNCRLIGGFGFDVVFALGTIGSTPTGQSARSGELRNLDGLVAQIRNQRPKTVLIVHFLAGLMSEPNTAPPSANWVTVKWFSDAGNQVSREQFLRGFGQNLELLANELSKYGGALVVTSPPPDFDWLSEPNDATLDLNFEDLCSIKGLDAKTRRRIADDCQIWRTESIKDLTDHHRRIGEIQDLLDQIQAKIPNFRHVSLDVPFCNRQICRNFIDGVPVYLDDDHLNQIGASIAVRGFADVFRPLEYETVPLSTELRRLRPTG